MAGSRRRWLGGFLARLGGARARPPQPRTPPRPRPSRPLQTALRLRLDLAETLRPHPLRGADDPRLLEGGNQRCPGRAQWRRQDNALARNLAYHALVHGHTVLFTTAGQLLGDLAALDSDSALRRRLRHYAAPTLLVIDEVGYLSYSNRHADLLFELISRRYEHKSTLITTNRPFAEWREVFPNAACVVSMVDRLMHNAEIVVLDGQSYRLKEAKERAEHRARQRKPPVAP